VLSWPEPLDVDIDYYLIRYSPSTTGAQWATAINLRQVPAPATSIEVPLKVGSYLLKAVDHYGNSSAVAASVSTSIPRVAGLNFVLAMNGHPAFAGTLDGTLVDSAYGGLRLDNSASSLAIAETQPGIQITVQPGVPLVVQAVPAVFEQIGLWSSSGYIDLGAIFTSRISVELSMSAVVIGDDVYNWTDVYDVEDVYGGVEDGVAVRAYVSTTNDNPAASPTWGEWRQVVVGDYTARAYRFRLELVSDIQGATPVILSARFVVDMPDRVYSTKINVPTGGTTIAFDPPFYVRPEVGITIQGGAAGDRPTYTVDANGMTIQILNTAGNGVARTVEVLARAYGERET
jgi:hypothetical protein